MALYRPAYESSTSGGSVYEIIAADPASTSIGSGLTALALLGSDYQSECVAYLNNVALATVFVSNARLEVTLPVGTTDSPGLKRLSVRGPLGRSSAFYWPVSYLVPTVSSVSVGTIDELNPFVTLTVTGTGFANGTQINADGLDCDVTVVNSTTLTAQAPIEIFDIPGPKNLYAFNPAPGGGQSNVVTFYAPYHRPTLTASSVSSAIAGRPVDIATTLTGTFIYGATEVLLDGVVIPSNYVNSTTATASIPSALIQSVGTYNITLRNPTTGGGGGSSDPLTFTVVQPTASSLDITEVVQYFDGFDVTMTLTDFVDANFVVTFNGVNQTTTCINSHTLVAHVSTAACAVVGTTSVRAKDTLSGISTNALSFQVYPWTITDIGSAIRLWTYGASAHDDGSGRADVWTDMSGGSRSGTQSTSGKRPRIDATVSALNNQKGLYFDGTRGDFFDGIVWLESGAAGVINKTAYNIWIVGAASGTQVGSGATILGGATGNIYAGTLVPGTQALEGRDDTGGAVTPDATFTWTGSAAFAFRQRKAGGKLYVRVNRGSEVSATHGANSALFVPTSLFIGKQTSTTGYYTGWVGEIIVADADLNTTYKALIDNRFSYLYNLPYGTSTAPTISSVSPNTATQYDNPFVFDVYNLDGSYTTSSTVNVGATPLTTTFVDAYHLQATMPSTALATAGGKAITVSDVGGISGPKGIVVSAYVVQPGPNLLGISPETVTRFQDAVTITCSGLQFTGTSVVRANGVAMTTVTTGAPTTITATLPASTFYVNGTVNITVTDGAYTSATRYLTVPNWTVQSDALLSSELDAANATTVSGAVSALPDTSGHGYGLAQGTAGARPTYSSSDSQFNNQPSMLFDGVNDQLVGSVAVNPNILTVSAWSAFVVYRPVAITGTGAITTPYANNNILGLSASGFWGLSMRNTPVLYGYTNDGAYKAASNTGLVNATTQAALYTLGSGTLSLYINGTVGTNVTGVGSVGFSSQNFTIGSSVGGNFANVKVAYVATFTGNISADTRMRLFNFSRWRFGTA